jgi:DNA-binding NtrC family response regulator
MAVLLVVDDDAAVRSSFARALGLDRHTVLEAGSVAQGIQVGAVRRPDLLVLDLKLPDGTGLDVLQGLSQRHPGIAALIVTGFGDIPSALIAGRLGVLQYLEKPVSVGALQAAVRRALTRAGFGAAGDDEPFDGIIETSGKKSRQDVFERTSSIA